MSNNNNNNDSNEFTYLFHGRSMDGWRMAGTGKFVLVEYDKSLRSEGGMGLLWYTKKQYRDFTLKVDWKVSRRNDNSGIFVRFSVDVEVHFEMFNQMTYWEDQRLCTDLIFRKFK